jgi:hypothetical protein
MFLEDHNFGKIYESRLISIFDQCTELYFVLNAQPTIEFLYVIYSLYSQAGVVHAQCLLQYKSKALCTLQYGGVVENTAQKSGKLLKGN